MSTDKASEVQRGKTVPLKNLSSGLFEAQIHTFLPHFPAFSAL